MSSDVPKQHFSCDYMHTPTPKPTHPHAPTHTHTHTHAGQENKKSVKIYSECKKQYAAAVELASASEREKMSQRRQMTKEWRDADVGTLIESRCQTTPSSFRDIAEQLNSAYEKTQHHLDRPFTKNDCSNKWRRLFPPSRAPVDLRLEQKRLVARFEQSIKHVPMQMVEDMLRKMEGVASQSQSKETQSNDDKSSNNLGSIAASWSAEAASTSRSPQTSSSTPPAPPASSNSTEHRDKKRKLSAIITGVTI